MSESRFVKAFINGAADMMSVVLIIALARSITVLMGETGLDMWILNNAANALNGLSAIIFAAACRSCSTWCCRSSSRRRPAWPRCPCPSWARWRTRSGFSADVMIMIFSAGNGLVNLFTPTSGAIMGGLALAKVEYSTWLKFGGKLFIVLGVACVDHPHCGDDAHTRAPRNVGCTRLTHRTLATRFGIPRFGGGFFCSGRPSYNAFLIQMCSTCSSSSTGPYCA